MTQCKLTLTDIIWLTWLKRDLPDMTDLTDKSSKSDLSQVSQVRVESNKPDLLDLKFVWNTACWLSWLDWVWLWKKRLEHRSWNRARFRTSTWKDLCGRSADLPSFAYFGVWILHEFPTNIHNKKCTILAILLFCVDF